MKIAYLANIRLPTEKAHGLQIMQMCEAFAQQPDVTLRLYVARRRNSQALRQVRDVFDYYGVVANFDIRRIACLDLIELIPNRLAFAIQMLTYLLLLGPTLHFQRADVYYSRDPFTLLMLSLFVPKQSLCYEVHQVMTTKWQAHCVRRVGLVVAITGTMAERMRTLGAANVIVAHDGFRPARFANMPDQRTARQQLGFDPEARIVGYVGRLNTLGMGKGLDNVIDAMAQLAPEPLTLCLVGGPDKEAAILRDQWLGYGLPAERFIYTGTVAAEQVPLYLSMFDVCLMPQPWNDHFAYYTSALKLFEYMAAGGAILATNLPATAEVVRNRESALLVTAGDSVAMAGALHELITDQALREKLGHQAKIDVADYAWDRRATRILAALNLRLEQVRDQRQ